MTNGIIFCVCNISHFSSTTCLEVMSKRTQEDSGEERVTAKSKPLMKLVSRCSERDPNVLASTASESPEKTRHENQITVSSWNEQQPRTGRPDNEQQPGLFSQHTDRFIVDDDDMHSNTVAESDMSLLSRSSLRRVNDRVRKILDQSLKRCNTRQQQTFFNMGTVSVFDIGSICIHGKELLKKLHSIKIQ